MLITMTDKLLTIVSPCYNEIKNIDYLIEKLEAVDYKSIISRLIFVDDDSPDGTSEYVKNLPNRKFDILCLRRIGRQGLSSAVIEGILLADTKFVAVMDADGQHDPRDLIAMFEKMTSENIQFIVGSRFINSELVESHAGFRAHISNIGNRIANKILGRNLTDPLTGFFIFERRIFLESIKKIRPSGFKILLDLLYQLKDSDLNVTEYPITFKVRHEGESKLDSKVLIEFADQIVGFMTKGVLPEKLFSFVLVGSIGLFIHLTLLYFFLIFLEFEFIEAQVLATLMSMVSNFSLNNILTFRRNRLKGLRWLLGLFAFILVCSLGAFANVGLAGYLFTHGREWWISGLIGILVGTVFNFSLSKFYIWKP